MAERREEPTHPRDPSPSDPEEAAASSRASSKASETSSGSLVEDAGPVFDGEREPPNVAPPDDAPLLPLPEWQEKTIADLLGIKGRVLHAAAGAAEQDWIYTELDLAAIAPPLTRICNRYDPIRQYADYGDPITVAIGVAGYTIRSLTERKRALEHQAPPPTEVPIPPAGTDTGPVPPPAPPAPPAPPPPRAASSLPATPGGNAVATAPPPPPEGAINAGEVDWERAT